MVNPSVGRAGVDRFNHAGCTHHAGHAAFDGSSDYAALV
jgi:hypothetical protein